MLTINDLSLRVAGRLLLDHASLSLPEGAKAGLVGRNGTGKTTLFRAITGDLSSETGSISLPRNTRIGQVAQEAPGTQEPLIDIVLAADTERAALLAEENTATDPERIAEIHIRLADIDAHSAEARAATILAGLGFDAEAQKRPASSFSGGWRMRVALAAVLFSQPDLLLLDEPTNYLDLEGTLWLENYVSRYPHTVLLISHDRDLLNRAVNSIVHLDQKKLTFWRGGYDQFERQRSEQLELQEKSRIKQEVQRKHLQSFVDRFRAKASKARQAQSRIKALEKMKPIAAVLDDTVRPFRFPEPVKTVASPIIALEGAAVGYQAGKPILKKLSLRIDADDRIALLGANGNGKSTFAKLLAGRLKARLRHDDDRAGPEGVDLRAAPARRSEAGGKRLRACSPHDAGGAGIQGAGACRAVRPDDGEDEHAGKGSVGRREGAAADGACGLRWAEPLHPGRADQPSRHRQPRGVDAGAE